MEAYARPAKTLSCGVEKTTRYVLDTAEASTCVCCDFGSLSDASSYSQNHNMDPRRARDPRLARQDPRLQQQQRSHSHTPTGQPPQSLPHQTLPHQAFPDPPSLQASTSQGFQPPVPSNYPPYPTATPPQYPGHDASNQQLTQEAQLATAPPPEQPSGYKQRPLFCVVCASNQVRIPFQTVPPRSDVLPRTGPWRGTLCYRECTPAPRSSVFMFS